VYTGSKLVRLLDSLLGPLGRVIEGNKKSLFQIYDNHTFGADPIEDMVIIHHWIFTAKCKQNTINIIQTALM
jgi:hypothetical protein